MGTYNLGQQMKNSCGSKKNSMHSQGIRFPHFQTYDRATVYHFYFKIYLETGASPLAELPGNEGALSFLSVTSDSHEL